MPDPVTVSVSATRERVNVSVDTVREVVQIKVISDSYSLPIASADTLGGVKIGDGLTITAGVLSVSGSSYTLPIATDTTLGGIKSSTDILVNATTGVATVNAVTTATVSDAGKLVRIDSNGSFGGTGVYAFKDSFPYSEAVLYVDASTGHGALSLRKDASGVGDIFPSNLTSSRTYQLQDSDGTFAHLSDIQSAKDYADSLVVGLLDDRGNWDASNGTFPVSGGSGTSGGVLKGDLWTISTAGTLGGVFLSTGDVLRALVDSPGQTLSNWSITENNLGYVPQNTAGILALAGFSSITGTIAISNVSGLQTALDAKANKSGAFENWVFEGDSWTAGTAQGNDRETFPYYINILVGNRINVVDVATAGQTASTMAGTFAAQVTPYLTTTTGKPSTAFIFAGINDGATRTTTQVRDDLRTMWTAARAQGAKVCAFTLPHRTAVGGWSQADWKTVNDQIITDASYYDFLVRMDVICSNAASADYTDNLHVTTATHAKIAKQILAILNGSTAYPVSPPDLVCNACSTSTLSASTRRNLPFTESYDANADGTTATVGSDSNTAIFTAPVDGTYEFRSTVCCGSLASGDTVYLNAWVTPLATGSEVEHRLDYQVSAGANLTVKGGKRIRMLRGDKVNIAIISSKAATSILSNTNNAEFAARLVSIP